MTSKYFNNTYHKTNLPYLSKLLKSFSIISIIQNKKSIQFIKYNIMNLILIFKIINIKIEMDYFKINDIVHDYLLEMSQNEVKFIIKKSN